MVTEAVSCADSEMHLTDYTIKWRNESLQQNAIAIFIGVICHVLNDCVWVGLIV